MQARKGRPEDLPALEQLRLQMPYPGSVFLDEKTWYAAALERLRRPFPPELRLLVLTEDEHPTGYFLLQVDDEHGVTHELQTLIVDFAVFSFEGLEKLVTRARRTVTAFKNLFLLVELSPHDKRLQLWFFRSGFRAEQNRAARFFPRGHKGKSNPLYRVRPAREEDRPFLLETHAAYPSAYLPGGRSIDLETLAFNYQLLYASMDLGQTHILEEVASGRPAGYMILQSAPGSIYVYDVAIAPAFAGRGLGLYLIGAAESLCGEQGAILYGDGSLGTKTIASWHAQMGYTVDTVRFALDCREQ